MKRPAENGITMNGSRPVTRHSQEARVRPRLMRIVAGGIAVIVALGLAGCSGIPRSGVVRQGEPVMQADTNAIEFLPASPVANASPEQILRGFLDAASSPQDDFAIARQFLGTAFKTQWNASASVVVDSGVRSVEQSETDAADLSTISMAAVDARGQYSEVSPATPMSRRYGFVNEGGQWRISAAPEGLLIDRFTFDQVFTQHALYFYDPTFSHLVPDLRWFPSGSSTTTRIMKALLGGPAPWLAEGGAVVTAFPAGTQLVADAVPIAGRVALVDLTPQALDSSGAGMQRMETQATVSLNSVDTVSEVQLLVDGNVQSLAPVTNPTLDLSTRMDSRPVVVQSGKFGFLSGDTIVPIAGLSEAIEPLGASAIAASSGLNVAAALTASGMVMIRPVIGVTPLDSRPGLISPSIDSSNYIWSVPLTAPTEIRVYSTEGQMSSLTAPWPAASRIVSLNMARDGTRLVALLDQNGTTKFVAANIQRGDRNRPIAIGTPISLATETGVPIDAAWADPLTAVSLVTSPDGTSRMMSQSIGGHSQSLPVSTAIVSLAGANLVTQLRIRDAGNKLYVLRGNSYWQLIASDVSLLAALQ